MKRQPKARKNDALKLEREHAARLRYLVGCVIEALEFYDADDGHNALVLAGITAELKEIEGEYEKRKGR